MSNMINEKEFYSCNEEYLENKFSTSIEKGLSDNQVDTNRKVYGENKLLTNKKTKWWVIFLKQYKDVLMIVLLISSIISLIVSIFPVDGISWGKELTKIEGWENFILIVGVTLINAILGTIQTMKSQKSLDSLKTLSSPKAKVIRNGVSCVIDSSDVVVGDIIILEAGDLVPADARIFECASLKVNESSLTGESENILKHNNIIDKKNVLLADRLNCVHSGSLVTYGRAKAIVTSVGQNTEIGKINTLLQNTKETKTPLQVNLDKLAKFLMWSVLVICFILFAFNISKIAFTDKSTASILGVFSSTLNFSIALAVAVIPEALSSIVTIVLSISTKKMAKKNAIVKNLKSVEGLGSVSVICSDKTGTITQNKMTVKGFYINGKVYNEDEIDLKNNDQLNLIKYSVLSSDAKVHGDNVIGDPTEVCLVEYLQKLKLDSNKLGKENPRISELSFDSERMMMSTLVKINNKNKKMLTKGAFDKILDKCVSILDNGKIRKINVNDIKKINEANNLFSNQGKRVLCFAMKDVNHNTLTFKDESNFVFVGLITMIDPPRPEVIEAIKECKVAGVKVVMITGDHQSTAVAISKEIGIYSNNDWSMSGVELSNISQNELTKNIAKYSVYARVSPQDKIKIVRAWQANNMIVSMTGDGVNDAPALKQADIGVAMGITGTEVSKDAASIILTDDNFATIVSAVKFGRSIYNNIKSSIKFLLTGNLATILIALVLTIFSFAIKITVAPFSAIQLLFLNILTDTWPAISLGLEKYKNNVIFEKPRLANEFFINKKFVVNIFWESLIMTIVVLCSFFVAFYTSNIAIDSTIVTNQTEYINNVRFEIASSCAFMTLAFSRFIHGFNCRSNHFILFKKEILTNPYLDGSLLLGLILLSFIFYVPGVNEVFLDIHNGTNLSSGIYKGINFGQYQHTLVWLSFVCSLSHLIIVQYVYLTKDFIYSRMVRRV